MNDSLREIARFLFPRLNCRQFLQDASYRGSVSLLIDEGVGGFVLFDGHVADCAGAAAAVRALAKERPLLLAADCEFGLTMRFEGGTEFPGAWALGSADYPELTCRVALAIAREMEDAGLDWNFAPVLDINTNPENPIINLRAFGEDPDRVAEHGTAFIRGLREGGMLSCGKHFPGHGDTAVDSHIGLPLLPFAPERLHRIELVPFRQAVEAGIPAIMSAHLALPSIDPSGDPASLSEPILKGLLREALGFDGVVVTDALDMGAIVERYGTEEAAVRAFLAGNDVLEIPDDPLAALEGLRRGVREGRISAERISRSARRLDLLLQWRAERREGLPASESSPHRKEEHESLALEAARKALKVFSTEDQLPIDSFRASFTASLIIRDETAPSAAAQWRAMVRDRFGIESVEVEVGAQRDVSLGEILKEREPGNGLLIALMIRPRGGAGSVGLGEEEGSLTELIRGGSSVLVNFGNPYLLRSLDPALRIDAFSSSLPSLIAAMEAL